VSVTAISAVSVGADIGLHEMLTDSMAMRYGALPLIPLPQEEEMVLMEMGVIRGIS
jgi:hypothetical protein